MNVTKYIKKLCEARNVEYEDITHTFYYKAFMDLYNKGRFRTDYYDDLIVDDDEVIKRARKMALNKIFSDDAVYNHKLELFSLIFEFGSDEVVDTAMSIVAEVDDIQNIPLKQIKALYGMAISNLPIDETKLSDIYHESINKMYNNYDIPKERWEIPFYHDLVFDPSIRNNNYQDYMSVLDDMPPAQYTDAATIICPFINQPSYRKGSDKRGIFCKVPFTEGIILDPQTNSIRYRLSKYITDVSEVGLRPKLRINPNNVPKNIGYIQEDERITEYGYWPNTVVSGDLRDDLDIALEKHELKEVGDITTQLLITGGRVIPNRVRCYEYRGELYALLPTRFKTGIAGPIMLSDRNSYNPTGELWTKIEPLKCYVDKKSGQLITADIIVSGIDKDFIEKYINSYFSESLHKFDNFFKNRKPEEVEFSEERKLFIKQINQMLYGKKKDSTSNDNKKVAAEQQGQNAPSVNVSLDQAITNYLNFDKTNIQISEVDDYIRIVNDIIEQLKSTEGINEDTIDSLRELIKPLEELNDPDNRIKRILEGGPGTKIADDEQALVIARQLIPKTNQIVEILCQKYNSIHDNQYSANDRIEELKQSRSQFRDCSEKTYQSTGIDASSYKTQDSLNRLIESASPFIKDESIKTLISEKIKPVDDVLDPNNRIKAVIASDNIPIQMQKENHNLIDATLNASRLLKPILDVIYEENNIEDAYIKKEPTQTQREDFFEEVTKLFSGLIPTWGAAETKISVATSQTEEVTYRKASSKKPIESATIEEALPILDQFSSEPREKDLKTLGAIINSKDVSFDMGKIDDLVFLVLKNQMDGSTHIFTNNPEIGYFEIASKEGTICNTTIYKNNYWIGQERHIMDYKQENRIPSIKEINYAIKRFDGIIERDVQSDTYNESSDIVTIRIGNTLFSGKYSREYDKLKKKGIKQETLNAIKSNIGDIIPPYIVEILQKYSPEIANEIQLGDRIFHD